MNRENETLGPFAKYRRIHRLPWLMFNIMMPRTMGSSRSPDTKPFSRQHPLNPSIYMGTSADERHLRVRVRLISYLWLEADDTGFQPRQRVLWSVAPVPDLPQQH